MKKGLLTLALFFSITQANFAQHLLNIEVKDINGQYSSIEELGKGELIIIDFWATWCKPCLKAIPKLVELSEKYPSNQVSFIGINEDSPRNLNKVKPLAMSLGISYPTLHDSDQEIASEFLVSAYPTLIILNKNGKELYRHEGFIPGDELIIENEINALLKKNE